MKPATCARCGLPATTICVCSLLTLVRLQDALLRTRLLTEVAR